jgi:hypothetical protein
MACARTVVLDSEEARPIFRAVLEFFEAQLCLPVSDEMRSIPVLAVDTHTLNERTQTKPSTHTRAHTRGLCLSEVGLVRHMTRGNIHWDSVQGRLVQTGPAAAVHLAEQRSVTAILVLHSLPRDLFASILAHETMHAWLRLSPRVQSHLPPQVAIT